MKKNLLSFSLALLTSNVFGQSKLLEIFPIENGKATYTGIVQVDSVSKDELYKRAKRWFVDTYKSAKAVIELDDKENGEIIGNGDLETYWGSLFIFDIALKFKLRTEDTNMKLLTFVYITFGQAINFKELKTLTCL